MYLRQASQYNSSPHRQVCRPRRTVVRSERLADLVCERHDMRFRLCLEHSKGRLQDLPQAGTGGLLRIARVNVEPGPL